MKQIWATLTADELLRAEGCYDENLGSLQVRAAQTREALEEAMNV